MKLSNILMKIVSLLLLLLSGFGDDNTQNANGEDASETEKEPQSRQALRFLFRTCLTKASF